jgi:hypothetical protein
VPTASLQRLCSSRRAAGTSTISGGRPCAGRQAGTKTVAQSMRRLCFVSTYLDSYPSITSISIHLSVHRSIRCGDPTKRSRSRVGPVARAASSPLLAARTAVSAGRRGACLCVRLFVRLLALTSRTTFPGETSSSERLPAYPSASVAATSLHGRAAMPFHALPRGAMPHGTNVVCLLRARPQRRFTERRRSGVRALFLGRERDAACARASPYAPAGDTSEEDEGGEDGGRGGGGGRAPRQKVPALIRRPRAAARDRQTSPESPPRRSVGAHSLLGGDGTAPPLIEKPGRTPARSGAALRCAVNAARCVPLQLQCGSPAVLRCGVRA